MIYLPSNARDLVADVLEVDSYTPSGAGRPPLESVYLLQGASGLYLFYRNKPICKFNEHKDGLGMSAMVRLPSDQVNLIPVGMFASQIDCSNLWRISPLYHGNLDCFCLWLAHRAEYISDNYKKTKGIVKGSIV